MAIYTKMGQYAVKRSIFEQMNEEEEKKAVAAGMAELAKFNKVTPSTAAKLHVWYNTYCLPYISSVYGQTPDPFETLFATLFSTAVVGTASLAAQVAAPAATASLAAAAIELVSYPIPFATRGIAANVLTATCGVVGSTMFGGLSLACLIALLSNDTTRNAIVSGFEATRNTMAAAAAPARKAGSYLYDQGTRKLAQLNNATDDLINRLKMSVENRLLQGGL
jgi:hypothetical protein